MSRDTNLSSGTSGATLGALLRTIAQEEPGSLALVGSRETMTYGELYAGACRLAAGLHKLGIRKGDVVGLQLPNTADFVLSYCALSLLGGVVSLLHMPYRVAELEPLLKHSGARAVICGNATPNYNAPAVMCELSKRLPAMRHIIVADSAPTAQTHSLSQLKQELSQRDPYDTVAPSDPLLLTFTSGTSSSPKCVLRTHESLLRNSTNIAKVYGLNADDRVLSAPPFTHVFGICCLNLAFRSRGAAVLLRQYSPEAYGNALALATVVFMGPAHVAAYLKANLKREESYSSVRIVGIAGSACPPSLVQACESLFPRAVVGQLFGMTETLMALVTPSDSSEHIRHNTVGQVTPEFEIRVADNEGNPVPSAHEGELQIRGYSVLSGYFGNVDATKQAFSEDGWFKTGDLAKLDEGGNVSLTGRLKDIVNRGGVKFNPADMEVLLESHPSVINAAIVGMRDEIMGERACLFLTLRPGASLCLEDVLAFLNENGIAKLKWPERLVVVDEMPMTPTRKIIKSKLNPQQES